MSDSMVQTTANSAVKLQDASTSLNPAEEAGKGAEKTTQLASETLARIKKREAEIERKSKELAARERSYLEKDQRYSKLKERPLEELEGLGITGDDLLKSLMAKADEKEPDPMDIYKKKVDMLESRLSEKEKEEKKREEEGYAKWIDKVSNDYLDKAWEFVTQNEGEYEFTIANDGKRLILEVVEEYFTRFGEIPQLKEAVDYVERYYVDEFQRFAKSKKARNLIEQQEDGRPSAFGRTLSNSLQSHSSPVLNERKFGSRREEIAAVARAFENKT